MKHLFLAFLIIGNICKGQLTIADAKAAATKYKIKSYTYHERYQGHEGYSAPLVLTTDGGAVMFGDHTNEEGKEVGLVVKLDKTGKEQWRHAVKIQIDNLESQSVLPDKKGNYFVTLMNYDYSKYRGGTERVVYLDKNGKVLWDKLFGEYSVDNSPHFSLIRLQEDGNVFLNGHIVKEKPINDEVAPKYLEWEGVMTNEGKIIKETTAVERPYEEWLKATEPK